MHKCKKSASSHVWFVLNSCTKFTQKLSRTARRLSAVCREMWADFYLAFNISACIIDGFKGGMIKYKARQPWTKCGIQGSKILQSWAHTSHTIVPMHFTFMQHTCFHLKRLASHSRHSFCKFVYRTLDRATGRPWSTTTRQSSAYRHHTL